ncbi:hypothetical protein QJS04_geneDACA001304 [Acorus gramineus]|uniref:Rhodanese domain-containing protein n=1 Tax=Acorus gramineus TaxID=55184 RepID=A0AAV9ACS4_ACOGR|nr:hypothetical protein QJS04_geneDACA001304 [Acorus gramineus]
MASSITRFSLPLLLPCFNRLSSPTQTLIPMALRFPLLSRAVAQQTHFRPMASAAEGGGGGTLKSVPVSVAHELLQAGHRYVDVRTPEEFGAGHPVGATNIPYMFKAGMGMAKNPKFMEEVTSTFTKDEEIIIGCQIGKRSLMAATDLSSAGFTAITDVAGGYSAWVQNGLPTEK